MNLYINKGFKYAFMLLALFTFQNLLAQEEREYKCVAITNNGDSWPNEKINYLVEFKNDGTLTRWVLRDGKWKNGQTFELCSENPDGSRLYVVYERIMSGSNIACADWLTVSANRSTISRSYRCPQSEYEFDYIFEEIE